MSVPTALAACVENGSVEVTERDGELTARLREGNALTPEVAKALASYDGNTLVIDGVDVLTSVEVAQCFAEFRGKSLQFPAVWLYTREVAAALALFKGENILIELEDVHPDTSAPLYENFRGALTTY